MRNKVHHNHFACEVLSTIPNNQTPSQEWAVRRLQRLSTVTDRCSSLQLTNLAGCKQHASLGIVVGTTVGCVSHLSDLDPHTDPLTLPSFSFSLISWGLPCKSRRTNRTKSAPSETFTKHHPQEGPHTQRALSSKRSASRRSSPTPPSASACACNSSRTARRSPLSYPCVFFSLLLSSFCKSLLRTMVASTLSMRTTKSSSPV